MPDEGGNENAKQNKRRIIKKKAWNTTNSTPAGYSKKIPSYTNAVSTFIIKKRKIKKFLKKKIDNTEEL